MNLSVSQVDLEGVLPLTHLPVGVNDDVALRDPLQVLVAVNAQPDVKDNIAAGKSDLMDGAFTARSIVACARHHRYIEPEPLRLCGEPCPKLLFRVGAAR